MTFQSIETVSELEAELQKRPTSSSDKRTLDKIKTLLDYLDDPQNSFRSIHITGTNGKTSTAIFTSKLIKEHGISVGTFISPHIEKINERIQVGLNPVDDEDLIDAYNEIGPIVELIEKKNNIKFSYFELLVALAFIIFADRGVEIAVIEVGLGGEYCPTNVVNSDIAIITHIDYDHGDYLGSTLEEIASAKAKIIKPTSHVVSTKQEKVVEDVIKKEFSKIQKDPANKELDESEKRQLLFLEKDFFIEQRLPAVKGQLVNLKTKKADYNDIYISMYGEHQIENMLLAISACELLLSGSQKLDSNVINSTFLDVSVKGRIEVVAKDPVVIFDVSHNPNAAKAMVSAIKENFSFDEVIFIISLSKDKNANEYIKTISEYASQIVVTKNDSDRATDIDTLFEIAKKYNKNESVYKQPTIKKALTYAKNYAAVKNESSRNSNPYSVGIVIAGSCYNGNF